MAAEIKITVSWGSSGGSNEVKKDLDSISDATKDAGNNFSVFKEIGIGALRAVGSAAVDLAINGFKAVAGAISDGIADAREAAKINAQTEAVLKSTGNAAGVSAEHIQDYAASLSAAAGKSLFGDSQIQESENLLLTFTNIQGAALDAATAISVDMAQALGGAPKDQAIQLGKALNDPIKGITALTRVGVTFSDEQKDMIQAMQETGDMAGAQQVILAELNKEFGGSAAAAAAADGGWAQFTDRMGEAKESIGAALLPALGAFAGILNDTVAPAIEGLATWLGANLPGAIAALQTELMPVIAYLRDAIPVALAFLTTTVIPALITAWQSIQPAIAMLIPIFAAAVTMFSGTGEGATALGGVITDLSGIWQHIQAVIAVVAPAIQALITAVFSQIQTFLNAHGTEIMAFVQTTWSTIVEIIHLALDLLVAILVPVLQYIAAFITAHGAEIQTIIGAMWSNIQLIIGAALTLIQGVIQTALQLIHGDWEGAWNTIQQTCATITLAIWGVINNWFTVVKTLFGSSLAAIGLAITTWFTNQLTNFGKGLAAIGLEITTWFTTQATNFTIGLAAVKFIWDTVWNTLKTEFQSILGSIVGWVVQTMTGIGNAIRSAADQVIGAAASVGAGIVRGIVSGIKDGASSIVSAAKDAAMAALDAAKSALGIGSPSKVFAASVGLPMAQGMAVGLGQGESLVARATERTADAAVGAGRSYTENRSITYAPVYNNVASADPGMDAAFARGLSGDF